MPIKNLGIVIVVFICGGILPCQAASNHADTDIPATATVEKADEVELRIHESITGEIATPLEVRAGLNSFYEDDILTHLIINHPLASLLFAALAAICIFAGWSIFRRLRIQR